MDEAEFGYRKYLINMSNREQRDVMLEKLSELYQQGIKDDPSKLNVKRLLLALNYNLGKINTNITIDDKSKYCSDSCTYLASYEACFSGYYCRLFGSLLERNEKENKWIRCGGCTWKVGNSVKLG